MILTTTEESRKLDRKAMEEYGLPEAVLMENAGRSVIELMKKRLSWKGKLVTIVCGTGNNGGDGFVAARYAENEGALVTVLIIGNEEHMSESSKMYLQVIEKMGMHILHIKTAKEAEYDIEKADIIIDALIGTGLTKGVTGEKADIIWQINADDRKTVISVDIPSGMNADTGECPIDSDCVRADYTIALGSIKRGEMLWPGTFETGEVLCSPIGIPDRARSEFPVNLVEEEEIARMFPCRLPIAHKGTNGFIGIFAGSAGMEGAALLSGQGALYAGAGKVAIVTIEKAAKVLACRIPELMVSSIGKPEQDHFTGDNAEEALEKAKAYDIIAIGPGLSRSPETMDFVEKMVKSWDKPMVIDADAIFALKERNIELKDCPGFYILTPHVGEFAHLTGLSAGKVEERRIDEAIRYAVDHHAALVLKGAPTVSAMPDGWAFVNTSGNPGMATGGMGDTLTGIIAALYGQGMKLWEAAVAGVYLHGYAGDLLWMKTEAGYRASELAEMIPAAREKICNHDLEGKE